MGASARGELMRFATSPLFSDLGDLGLFLAGLAAMIAMASYRRGRHRRLQTPLVRRLASSVFDGLTNQATAIAGRRRRQTLWAEWQSHLAGEDGRELAARRKARAALGFVFGALQMRLRDLGDLAWIPSDRVLGSRILSNLFVLVPTASVGTSIYLHAGTIDVMVSMESIAATGGVLYGLVKCGRWYRDVKPPDPSPRSKD